MNIVISIFSCIFMFDRRLLENIDWVLILIVILISSVGIITIYSASISYGLQVDYYQKQILWLFLGLMLMIGTTLIDYRTLGKYSIYFHLFFVFLLVLVLFYGVGGTGSPVNRWLKVGPFFLQPSEFVKFSSVMCLAHYFSDPRRIGDLGIRELIWPTLIILVPLFLIIRQPDLGTASLLIFSFFPIIFLVGIRIKIFLIALGISLISIILLVLDILNYIKLPFLNHLLKPYQRNRILILLNPDSDRWGRGYHIIQSEIAIGSGNFWGKGLFNGTQTQLDFLPAKHTDFIFSVFSEEWGFLGSLTLLAMYTFIIFWCLRFVGKTKDRSGTVLTVGVTSILIAHILINISMVLGRFPVVGLPLPFFSYGGSAMISMMIGVGLILNVRMRRFDL